MAIAAAAATTSSLSLGSSHCHSCHTEGVGCSTSNRITSNWMKNPIDGRRVPDLSGTRNPAFGSTQFHWLSTRRDLCPSKVSVAADYSDSVPDSSSNQINSRGYHPLEEVKSPKRIRDTKLTPAEIARTTVEANSSCLLVFPGTVHCEPHEKTSWAEFHYVIDDYGDIFFEIFDDENILQDPGANNPVNALIGMDIPIYENQRIAGGYNILDIGATDDMAFDDEFIEIVDSEVPDGTIDWGMPDISSLVHPTYFAKCLTKAVNMEHDRKMDYPSNGVSILGCLRPAFADEETYLRRQFRCEDSDGYNSEWKDGEAPSDSGKSDRSSTSSTLYRLEIMGIELFSLYGVQSSISLEDFQDAEPDILVHSMSVILKHFNQMETRCDVALKGLCKKKGVHVEKAKLIGVDSLGMDVRLFSGVEVRSHRFPFKVRATSAISAEKQIQQLLFPRSRRKKYRTREDGIKEP